MYILLETQKEDAPFNSRNLPENHSFKFVWQSEPPKQIKATPDNCLNWVDFPALDKLETL